MKRKIFVNAILNLLLASATPALAQETRHEISLQGTGFFTRDSQQGGTSFHSTDTGGFLAGYRFHINSWLAADATYGYDRNTQQSLALFGSTNIQTNVHQATGSLVVTLPIAVARLRPYALAGAGALVVDPTGKAGGFVPGAQSQAKPAFVYGVGADYNFSNHIALRAEYRGLVYNRPDFGLGLQSGVTTHTAQPSAGVVFKF